MKMLNLKEKKNALSHSCLPVKLCETCQAMQIIAPSFRLSGLCKIVKTKTKNKNKKEKLRFRVLIFDISGDDGDFLM